MDAFLNVWMKHEDTVWILHGLCLHALIFVFLAFGTTSPMDLFQLCSSPGSENYKGSAFWTAEYAYQKGSTSSSSTCSTFSAFLKKRGFPIAGFRENPNLKFMICHGVAPWRNGNTWLVEGSNFQASMKIKHYPTLVVGSSVRLAFPSRSWQIAIFGGYIQWDSNCWFVAGFWEIDNSWMGHSWQTWLVWNKKWPSNVGLRSLTCVTCFTHIHVVHAVIDLY